MIPKKSESRDLGSYKIWSFFNGLLRLYGRWGGFGGRGGFVIGFPAAVLAIRRFKKLFVLGSLLRGQLRHNFGVNSLELLVGLGGNGFPQAFHAVPAILENDFDAFPLFGCETELLLHAIDEFGSLAGTLKIPGASLGRRRGEEVELKRQASSDHAGTEDDQGR